MELNNHHCIGQGNIIHKRTKDTENFFQYNAPYLCLNLNQTHKIHPLISLNRFNFFILNIFGSLKAIILIHFQALKLFIKKSKLFKYSHRIKDNLYLD